MLWLVGGITALCGALTYAELGTALPRSGGEYNFLARIYHPAVGFVSGWTTATVGFAAPTALAAITSGTYFASVFPALSPRWVAVFLIAALAAVHATTRRSSGGTQRALTFATVLLIVVFCVLGWTVAPAPQDVRLLPTDGDVALIGSAAFAVALIYVNYAYSGWNAATYVTGELERPRRTLARVLAESGRDLLEITLANREPTLPTDVSGSQFESMVARRGVGSQLHFGLGLYVVSVIVAQHGDTVRATNLNGGSGVTIMVRLPHAKATAPTEQTVEAAVG